MTPDDLSPASFVDMVLALLESQFPWLATDSQTAVGGKETVDQLIKLHGLLLQQPTAHSPQHAARIRLLHAPKEKPQHDQLHRRKF
jgi:hypothetical protein